MSALKNERLGWISGHIMEMFAAKSPTWPASQHTWGWGNRKHHHWWPWSCNQRQGIDTASSCFATWTEESSREVREFKILWKFLVWWLIQKYQRTILISWFVLRHQYQILASNTPVLVKRDLLHWRTSVSSSSCWWLASICFLSACVSLTPRKHLALLHWGKCDINKTEMCL